MGKNSKLLVRQEMSSLLLLSRYVKKINECLFYVGKYSHLEILFNSLFRGIKDFQMCTHYNDRVYIELLTFLSLEIR